MAFEGFLTSIYAGNDVSRPTFFELIAQEQLVDLFRPAVGFVVRVYADRAPPRLLGLFTRWESCYDILLAALEWRFLRVHSATFGENFYGLERQEHIPGRILTPLEAVEMQRRRLKHPGLTRRQRFMSLVMAVVVPWVHRRSEARYREVVAMPASAHGMLARWSTFIYPYLYALSGSVTTAYKLLYLLGQTEFWSPKLHIVGIRLSRHFPEPPGATDEQPKSLLPRLLAAIATAGGFSLWAGIYLLQFAQWWFHREHLLQPYQQRKVPPPPPPRSPYDQAAMPPLAEDDPGRCHLVLLPEDRTVCPLCHRPRQNPTASIGGYVFCYPCLVEHVRRFEHCPVTGLYMKQEHVRRIIED